jgi:hypothetical protein
VTRDELLATYDRRRWRALFGRREDSELSRVRARRPHAPEADPQLAHDEYAIAVGDGGRLVMWRFTPLRADEDPEPGAQLVDGRPRYGAVTAEETRFDQRDVARAAEQLAAAQQNAAVREAAAIASAQERAAELQAECDLAEETESTGEALRGVTGQGGREDSAPSG